MGSEKKNTLSLKFKLLRMDTLLDLSSKITPCNKNNFIYRFGQILDLLTTSVDVLALVALSQYYDPPLRCFTFKEHQLTPTIKEYGKLLEKERGDNHRWFELAVKEKKVLRDESDLEIQKLKLFLCEANAKVEVELCLKEEAIRVSYITPQNESLGWLNEKAQMNSLLDTYAGSINLL
ncbi:hypothetical protein KIW84_034995 [Lathyrus oleraceus]|uniref:DUF7745 domain-containing protein n=1 Tax=Pisum sativum TaxID=3888 RepID=A0A9D4Y496_PEA|nr:hypothetical protein KIW84_034995 [Pisum sativum]